MVHVGALRRATTWNILVILPVLGVTWVFGVLSVNQQLVAFQYVFAVANSLQARHQHVPLSCFTTLPAMQLVFCIKAGVFKDDAVGDE